MQELWGGDLEQRLAVTSALGMTGRMAERGATGMDPEMGRAVLNLLQSARPPAMAEAGRLLPNAAQRPGLALIAVDDFARASGTLVQHEWAGRQSGARMAHLEGLGHRWLLAAYRGQTATAERLIREVRADGRARGESYAVSAANFAEAILYNGVGRYAEAVEAAQRELPYTHELNHAMRTLLELVEAATRTGRRDLAEQAVEQLYLEALERFERERIPIMIGRTRLLHGEMLRRAQRRIDARVQLRGAHDTLSACGLTGFAERAAREFGATGETLRFRAQHTYDQLTEQEQNVARLAREGLSNREIGARLFISDRTAEYHLRKVFIKLGITSRTELKSALSDPDDAR